MRQAERLGVILEELSAGGSVAVTDLCGRLGVSAATVRRDLELLERQRFLTRTHGGAVAHGVLYELPLRYKTTRHQEEKRRIAAEAARRVPDGAAIGLSGGTTTTEVARALTGRRLTIVTNALNIASELVIRPDIKLVVTGGVARPESYELVGPIAQQTLEELHLEIVFMGVDGITAADGLTTHHDLEAHTNRALIERARRVIVVTDGSKLGRVAFAKICPVEIVHELITDPDGDPRGLQELREAGLEVTVV